MRSALLSFSRFLTSRHYMGKRWSVYLRFPLPLNGTVKETTGRVLICRYLSDGEGLAEFVFLWWGRS